MAGEVRIQRSGKMKKPEALNHEGKDQWNKKAEFWDNLHGEKGNQFHNQLVRPNVEKLLGNVRGKLILDVGCGNGAMARALADMGANVTAVDFSLELINRAKAYQGYDDLIKYQVLDATNYDELLTLGEGQFDAVISTMALMDMPKIFPLFSASRKLLKADGYFVFVTSHPSFNSNLPSISINAGERDGERVVDYSMKITHYLEPKVQIAMGAPNEPNPHYFYHRPLSMILNEAFKAGFVLDAYEESSFDIGGIENRNPLSWDNLTDIPQVIAGRLLIK